MTAAFDKLAATYDDQWTNSPVGRSQRNAVWRRIDHIFLPGDTILDLGCGTGEDALHLMRNGINVHALDASTEMVRQAQLKGVSASQARIEDLDPVEGVFDGALSNFGAMNCISDIGVLLPALSRLIRPGGKLAICLIGRFCVCETLHYFAKGEASKAIRRWSGVTQSQSLNLTIHYPTVSHVQRALRPGFTLRADAGIGLCVPPSFVTGVSESSLSSLDAIDRMLAHLPFFRSLADHRLLIFERTAA
jgi:ubiquinone/menaquinone biosynthesis C-methylase UbiE